MFSCAEDPAKSNKLQDEKQDNQEVVKEKNSKLLEISGKVFSIPSPIQTAFLLKEVGTSYQADILNPTANASKYATKSAKALNLGIYGADLGYATIFDNTEDAISYVAITKKISGELGITNLFNAKMMQRFEANIGNQDSLLAMVSDAFKSADQYLKNSKQDDIGVLILAGGWIETLHFASTLAKSTKSEALKNRIGEQKITIKNLINLLLPYQDKEEVASLINQLNELKDIYSGINYEYTYVEPETNPNTKTTIIKSKSTVVMTEAQLKTISDKISEIRSSII
ncbi:MAG: hypothetical protein DWP98_03680 [Bacteroidetes bacterium]|nr:MAG: hypothetical protein DWP98_03680 [Bacteroidota bacterium]MBL1144233.1 hypothetical protein [Bacteroidota bacterium]